MLSSLVCTLSEEPSANIIISKLHVLAHPHINLSAQICFKLFYCLLTQCHEFYSIYRDFSVCTKGILMLCRKCFIEKQSKTNIGLQGSNPSPSVSEAEAVAMSYYRKLCVYLFCNGTFSS